MNLVTPERWYIAFWLGMGLVALSPLYYLAYRILTVLDEIRFIMRVTR